MSVNSDGASHAVSALGLGFPMCQAAVSKALTQTSCVMFLFVSGLKQVALTHGVATATLPMLAALIISGVLSYAGVLFVIKPSLVGEALDAALVALGRVSLFQGIKSRRAIPATLLQVFRLP